MNKYTYMRERAGYTMRQLAAEGKEMGYYVTAAIISDVENGHVKPSLDVLRTYYAVCESLDCETFKLPETDVRTGVSMLRDILTSQNRGHEELQAMLGVSDRKVRDYLLELKKALKKEGRCVINLQDGRGYRIPQKYRKEDIDDVIRYRQQEASRIYNMQVSIDAADAYLTGTDALMPRAPRTAQERRQEVPR